MPKKKEETKVKTKIEKVKETEPEKPKTIDDFKREYRVFPRYDLHHRAFKNRALADAYAAKIKDVISIGEIAGGCYEVCAWKYFNTPEDLYKDEAEYKELYPKIEQPKFEFSKEEAIQFDKEFKEKITKEKKPRKKDDKKKKNRNLYK